jgi:hypothetical protein
LWSQEYILTKNANLRKYVVIGNEDAQDLLLTNNTFGKGKQIKVEYVWFKVKKKQLLCTFNEFGMNLATITKYMNADSEEFGTLIADSIDYRERNQVRECHKFLSELSPSQIRKVVSFALILLILILTSS